MTFRRMYLDCREGETIEGRLNAMRFNDPTMRVIAILSHHPQPKSQPWQGARKGWVDTWHAQYEIIYESEVV